MNHILSCFLLIVKDLLQMMSIKVIAKAQYQF